MKNESYYRIILKDNSYFRLICWENNDSMGGWLCRNCEHTNTDVSHLNLLKIFVGTIVESWGFASVRDDLICNMEEVLIDYVTYGIGDWENYFKECCNDENVFPQI